MRHVKRFRLFPLAVVAALALAAAGCGGDDGGGDAGGSEDVSGAISVLAVWTGQEGDSFNAVLDGLCEKYPNVEVTYRSAAEPATVLSTAVEGGNPPDVAALPSPGIMKDFANRDALKSIDFARPTLEENYSEGWLDLGSVDGTLYGVFFKGVNKSTVWYNTKVFEDAGIEPPTDWQGLLDAADTLKQSGVPAYSIGGSNGWTLTDLFENILLRTAGPDVYDQLVTHEIPWTSQEVKDALTEMGTIFKDTDNIAGGTSGALQTDFPTSVQNLFTDPPKGAMTFEGDFVAGVIRNETSAEDGDYDVFPFPSIGGEDQSVSVGAGDVVVMFKDNPAARALIEYLATPEAQEIWAARGGFTAPGKNVDSGVYPDEITRTAAEGLGSAETFRFDLSDLLPAAFGSDAMFTIFQDFLKDPSDVDGIASRLEAEAKKTQD